MPLNLGSNVVTWRFEESMNDGLFKVVGAPLDWDLRTALLSLNGGIKPHFQEDPDLLIANFTILEVISET